MKEAAELLSSKAALQCRIEPNYIVAKLAQTRPKQFASFVSRRIKNGPAFRVIWRLRPIS
jgi:hypothetical protein